MFANFVTRQCRKTTFEENVVLKLKNGTDVIRLAADGLTAGPNRRHPPSCLTVLPPDQTDAQAAQWLTALPSPSPQREPVWPSGKALGW